MTVDHHHACVRCAEEPVPARVIDLLPARFALVATAEGLAEVSLAVVDARIGDLVLVHAGEVVGPAERRARRRLSHAAAGGAPGRHPAGPPLRPRC